MPNDSKIEEVALSFIRKNAKDADRAIRDVNRDVLTFSGLRPKKRAERLCAMRREIAKIGCRAPSTV